MTKPVGFYNKGAKTRPISARKVSARGNSRSENSARTKLLKSKQKSKQCSVCGTTLKNDNTLKGGRLGDGTPVCDFCIQDFGEESFEESTPSHMDYVKSSSGRLGSKTSVSVIDGGFLGEFDSEEKADAAIREHMKKNKIYSTVWSQSDHGNNIVDSSFRGPQT